MGKKFREELVPVVLEFVKQIAEIANNGPDVSKDIKHGLFHTSSNENRLEICSQCINMVIIMVVGRIVTIVFVGTFDRFCEGHSKFERSGRHGQVDLEKE